MTVLAANGSGWFERFLGDAHRFERVQLEARNAYHASNLEAKLGEFEKREAELKNRILKAQHEKEQVELKKNQIERELQRSLESAEKLKISLEDKTRQVANWRAMYESRRGGRSGLGPENAAAAGNSLFSSSRSREKKNKKNVFSSLGLGTSFSGSKTSAGAPSTFRLDVRGTPISQSHEKSHYSASKPRSPSHSRQRRRSSSSRKSGYGGYMSDGALPDFRRYSSKKMRKATEAPFSFKSTVRSSVREVSSPTHSRSSHGGRRSPPLRSHRTSPTSAASIRSFNSFS